MRFVIPALLASLSLPLGGGVASAQGGVPVVENPAPNPNRTPYRLSPSPRLTIGGTDAQPSPELYAVWEALLTTSGNLVVVHKRGTEIREFDSTGRFVRTIGKVGTGPGQFREASKLVALPGDSLLLHDASLQRITVFGPDRRVARVVSGTGRSVRCCTADGHYLSRVSSAGPTADATIRSAEWWIGKGPLPVERDPQGRSGRGSPATRIAASAGPRVSLPSDPARVAISQGRDPRRGPSMMGVPFSPEPMIRFTDSSIVSATGDGYEYRVYGTDGKLRRIVRAAAPPVPVTAEQIAARRALVGRTQRDTAVRAAMLRTFDGLAHRKVLPAFSRISTEENGTVWVRNYTIGEGEPTWWARYDESGRLTGTLRVPSDRMVLRFTQGSVILLESNDDWDFERLHVHQIRRGGPPRRH